MSFLMYFLLPFLKIITIFVPFIIKGYGRSFINFVYIVACSFAMVSSPAFNISMITLCFPAAFPFFIFLSAASTSYGIIGGAPTGFVCIVIACSLSYNYE